jgi:choline kinase
MKAVILAAGVGSRLAPLTDTLPKALVPILGKPLLFRQLDYLAQAGIPSEDVVIVGGYLIDKLRAALRDGGYACKVIVNDKYSEWNNFYSVLVAQDELRGHDFLQLDGDTVLDGKILPKLMAAPGDGLFAVDTCANLDTEAMKVQLQGDRIVAVDKKLDPAKCAGEYIGVIKISAGASAPYFAELARLADDGLTNEYYEHAVHRLAQRGEATFGIVDVSDCQVLEIDDHADLQRAEQVLATQS